MSDCRKKNLSESPSRVLVASSPHLLLLPPIACWKNTTRFYSTNDTSLFSQQQQQQFVAPTPTLAFLPDFTEHPKPKKRKKALPILIPNEEDHPNPPPPPPIESNNNNDDDDDITFFHDFVSGGVAGSASVVIGHPFDTLKVRIQTATGPNTGILQSIREFGGVASLFRGMAAPLGAAAVINAIIFGSYGFSSRLYDDQISATNTFADDNNNDDDDDASGLPTHDPWQKAIACGSFAGLVQCFIICPMEHVKCRLQTQGTSSATTKNMHKYIGPLQATRHIVAHHGVQRLYQGWWSTVAREVPAFGLYFAIYDHLKDRTLTLLRDRERCLLAANGTVTSTVPNETTNTNSNKSLSNKNSAHAWMASAIAGGCSGSLTWAVVYPVDLIKSKIQTAPLTTPFRQLSMWNVGRSIYQQHGWRFFFRGLGITVVRAFPVNGTIFPVYEFTLQQMSGLGY